MKILSSKDYKIRSKQIRVLIEPQDIGEVFLIKAHHIAYGMGSGYVAGITVKVIPGAGQTLSGQKEKAQ